MCTSRYVSTRTREAYGRPESPTTLGRVALHRLNRRKTSCRPTQASTIARIVIVATGILALSVTASATRRRGQPPRGATTPTSGRVWSRRRPRQASTCSVDLIECRRWWFTQEPGRRAPPGRQSSSASARADSWCGDEEAGERCVGLSQCEATSIKPKADISRPQLFALNLKASQFRQVSHQVSPQRVGSGRCRALLETQVGRWVDAHAPSPGLPRLLRSHTRGPSARVSRPSQARAAHGFLRSPASTASSRVCRKS